MTREEHLKWAKERAFKQENGLMMWVSFIHDISKHDKLKDHTALDELAIINGMGSITTSIHSVKRYIDGFN